MIREDGYEVELAAEGAAAIHRLARAPMPDVLITDLTFADGVAVTRYARSRRAALPVFMVTGYPHLVARYAESIVPAPIVLTKPLDYEIFSEQLRYAVRRLATAQ